MVSTPKLKLGCILEQVGSLLLKWNKSTAERDIIRPKGAMTFKLAAGFMNTTCRRVIVAICAKSFQNQKKNKQVTDQTQTTPSSFIYSLNQQT